MSVTIHLEPLYPLKDIAVRDVRRPVLSLSTGMLAYRSLSRAMATRQNLLLSTLRARPKKEFTFSAGTIRSISARTELLNVPGFGKARKLTHRVSGRSTLQRSVSICQSFIRCESGVNRLGISNERRKESLPALLIGTRSRQSLWNE